MSTRKASLRMPKVNLLLMSLENQLLRPKNKFNKLRMVDTLKLLKLKNNKLKNKFQKTSEALKAEDKRIEAIPVVIVNKEGKLEDHEGKAIVDKSGKPIEATKEQVKQAKDGEPVKVTEEQVKKAEE